MHGLLGHVGGESGRQAPDGGAGHDWVTCILVFTIMSNTYSTRACL